MVAFAQQTLGLGTAANDDTGDDLRAAGGKINNNFAEIFGAITFEAGGAKAITFDAAGNSVFSGSVTSDKFVNSDSVKGVSLGNVGGKNRLQSIATAINMNSSLDQTVMSWLIDRTAILPGGVSITDLGSAALKFKDLYLSGGAFLGGTAAANLLDDYEEGSFTPVFIAVSGSGTITHTTQLGRYTKIGDTVYFELSIAASSLALRTGGMSIDGLPFVSSTAQIQSCVIGTAGGLAIQAGQAVSAFVLNTSTVIQLRLWDSAGGTSILLDTELTDDGSINVSGTYKI